MLPARRRKPLTCQLRIAGETFLSHQIDVDLDDRILLIRHPEFGELKFPDPITDVRYAATLWDLHLAKFRYLQVLHRDPCQVPASQGAQHLAVWPGEGCF